MLRRYLGGVGPLLLAGFLAAPAFAQVTNIPPSQYEVRLERSVLVAMRDGVRLSTDLYFPIDASGPLPVIQIRLPYGKNQYQGNRQPIPDFFASRGYVVAIQDMRGRFESEGDYVVGRANRDDVPAPAFAQVTNTPPPQYEVRLERSVLVPMRDGVRLSTDLYFPIDASGPLPVIQIRLPYGKNQYQGFRGPGSVAYFFAARGYVVAIQDMRGRFESEGEYVVGRANRDDGYDFTTWLANRP